MNVFVGKQRHQDQQRDSHQRPNAAITAGILELKIGIVNFRQGTPFPSGTMARRTVGRDRHAWPPKVAMRFKSAGIRKREGEDAGRKVLNSARKLQSTEAP
jgi:hypothetical protein